MRTIHLKLPNEKQNEASLTERGFCEREGAQDGRWPIVSNVISILVDGFPMWVSCTRTSGCLQSNMIYSWLLVESPHTLTCTHSDARLRTDTEGDRERGRTVRDSYAGLSRYENLALPNRQDQTHLKPTTQVSRLSLLCVSLRCQSIRVPLPCP